MVENIWGQRNKASENDGCAPHSQIQRRYEMCPPWTMEMGPEIPGSSMGRVTQYTSCVTKNGKDAAGQKSTALASRFADTSRTNKQFSSDLALMVSGTSNSDQSHQHPNFLREHHI